MTDIRTQVLPDGYVSHYRLWGPARGEDVIVVLHGAMSHSGWQAPLAEAVTSTSDISFVAPDRRGAGLNNGCRGHMLSPEQVVDDAVATLRELRQSFNRVHLAGWCFGGQVAANAAARVAGEDVVSTLLLIAPGFFWSDRYSDVLRLSIQSVLAVVDDFGLTPQPERAFIPLPLQPTDFTMRPEWHRFITDDPLRLTKVTKNTVSVSYDLQERAKQSLAALGPLPVLAVLGGRDRLVDNDRVRALLTERVPDPALTIEVLDANHGVQFDQPEKLAELLTGFVAR
jgi:pimeloyl-ACP methyl ester carboxylesterase